MATCRKWLEVKKKEKKILFLYLFLIYVLQERRKIVKILTFDIEDIKLK